MKKQGADRQADDRGRWAPVWAADADCAWALVFAAMSYYWALGGMVGIETQAPGIKDLARDRAPWFVAVLRLTGALKPAAALLALALVQRWGRVIPRRLLLVAAWGAGAGMVLYGGLNLAIGLVVAGLRAADVVSPLDPGERAAALRHLVLWDSFWLAGGILFMAAARTYQHQPRNARG